MECNLPQIITTIGLFSDIIGAIFVSWEVVRQYKGKQFKPTAMSDKWVSSATLPPQKTEDFKFWEREKYCRMKIGLGFLLTGFILQIIAVWI